MARRLASLALAACLAMSLGCAQDDRPTVAPAAEETPSTPALATTDSAEPGRPAASIAEPEPRQSAPAEDMLTALRLAVEADLARGVRLDIDEQRDNGRWGFVTAVARDPHGGEIDYATTRYAEDVKDGVFDDWLCALLEKDGTLWRVVALEIGATDVPFVDWPERYGVPREIVLP